MRDFPPDVRAYTDRGADAPDTRSPRAFLWWMVRQNGGLFWAGLLVALIWMVPQTVGPWMVGRAIDTGIVAGDSAATTPLGAGRSPPSPSSAPRAASPSTPSSCASG